MSHVFRWDLDKTYLATDFDSLSGLVRSALQRAEQKQNVPGTGALMRELQAPRPGVQNRIHVVSGSPRQMRRVLERKLRLDGATVDSFTLKPNLGNLLRLRFRALRDQLGYKLPALLESRAALEPDTEETCLGDDAEMDGLVYRLYGDICAGRVRGAALCAVLEAARLYADQVERIHRAAARVPGGRDPVRRILIHLETGSPTGRFAPLGPRVVPTFNTFQAALVLHADGHLTPEGVANVAEEMMAEYGYDVPRLQRSLEDAVRRGAVEPAAIAAAAAHLVLDLPDVPRQPAREETAVDYVAVLAEIREYHGARKAARRGSGRVGRLPGRDN